MSVLRKILLPGSVLMVLIRSSIYLSQVLFCTLIVISSSVHAESQADNDAAVNIQASVAENEAVDHRPSVEVRADGGIELEKGYRTEAEARYKWHTHMVWESYYVAEGRDALSGNGLYSMSSEFILDDIAFVPWFAHSPNADYSELNLNFVYSTFITRSFAASVAYKYLRFYLEDEQATDNEVSLDLNYQILQSLTATAVIYHSFEADGAFTEIGTQYGGELNKKVYMTAAVLLGANQGYVPDGHKGVNYFQLRTSTSYMSDIQLELYATANYTWAINRNVEQYPGDESLRDFFWGGVGIVYLF